MEGKNDQCLPRKKKRIIFVFVFVISAAVCFYCLRQNGKMSSALGLRKSQTISTGVSSATSLPENEKHQLLLVAKARSGSSYISAIISKDPSVFYTFEPLVFLDQEERFSENKDLFRKRVYGVLKLYLQCDLMSFDAIDMNSTFHVSTKHGKKFIKCERKLSDGFTHMQCLLDYVKKCQNHDLTFSKVIRFPMRFAQDLLQMMPNLKIIYLIRDPRAVLYSQVKHLKNVPNAWGSKIEQAAEIHCRELKEDFRAIRKLKTLFPGRIRVTKYENGASDTLHYTKEIYNFAGLEFTDDTLDYISYLQSPGDRDDNRAYGLRRSNTTKVMNQWRLSKGSYEAALLIDKFCGTLYPKLGYLKVASRKALLSLEKPLHRKVF